MELATNEFITPSGTPYKNLVHPQWHIKETRDLSWQCLHGRLHPVTKKFCDDLLLPCSIDRHEVFGTTKETESDSWGCLYCLLQTGTITVNNGWYRICYRCKIGEYIRERVQGAYHFWACMEHIRRSIDAAGDIWDKANIKKNPITQEQCMIPDGSPCKTYRDGSPKNYDRIWILPQGFSLSWSGKPNFFWLCPKKDCGLLNSPETKTCGGMGCNILKMAGLLVIRMYPQEDSFWEGMGIDVANRRNAT